MIVIYVEFFT